MAANLASFPPAFLQSYPVLQPPPGVKSNFVNPENHVTAYVVGMSVLMGLAYASYAARLYTRLYLLRAPFWDDLTCGLGLLFTTINYAGGVLGLTKGIFGKHMWDVNLATLIKPETAISQFLAAMSWSLAQGFVKLTFFLLYYHIFRQMRWLRISIYIGGTVCALFYLSYAIADIALASPKHNQTWFQHFVSPEMSRVGTINIGLCATGLAFDIFIFALPTRAVMKLQLSKQKKMSIIFIFMLGLLACVASALSLALRVRAEHSADQSWVQTPVTLVALLEMVIGIIAACLVVSQPMLPRMKIAGSKVYHRVTTVYSSIKSGRKSSKDSLRSDQTEGMTEVQETTLPKFNSYLNPSVNSVNGSDRGRPVTTPNSRV